MKEKWILALSLLLLGLGLFCGMLILNRNAIPRPDSVKINRLTKSAAENWDHWDRMTDEDLSYDFALLDQQEQLVFRTAEHTSSSFNEGIQNHDVMLDVTRDGKYLGKILIHINYQDQIMENSRNLTVLTIGIFLSLAILILLFFAYLNRRVLRPFQKLNYFASSVAAGNLDIPLVMEHNNLFGPFTESFDLMRTQLAETRRREALANQSKKELVATLSHDIKTPVTSIKLLSELLEVTAQDEGIKDNLRAIYGKADQIDHLITNMFQASLEELGQLKVAITEEESQTLAEMLSRANYDNRITMNPVPDCLLRIDPLRMQQVLDNIINNSIKYANTGIDVSFTLIDEFLKLVIMDYGAGVPEEELPLLFQKYYRGSKAIDEKKDGSGIGLYLAAYLMEQMGGTVRCFNHAHGFAVELLIPLAF